MAVLRLWLNHSCKQLNRSPGVPVNSDSERREEGKEEEGGREGMHTFWSFHFRRFSWNGFFFLHLYLASHWASMSLVMPFLWVDRTLFDHPSFLESSLLSLNLRESPSPPPLVAGYGIFSLSPWRHPLLFCGWREWSFKMRAGRERHFAVKSFSGGREQSLSVCPSPAPQLACPFCHSDLSRETSEKWRGTLDSFLLSDLDLPV